MVDVEAAAHGVLTRYLQLLESGGEGTPDSLLAGDTLGSDPQVVALVRRGAAALAQLDRFVGEVPTSVAEPLAPQDVVTIESQLDHVQFHAAGGLGEVHVYRDERLGREIAVKTTRDHRHESEEHRRRFLREAEITGALEHPGIVPVYGVGTDATGRPFYAMRFVKGENLAEAVAQFYAEPADDRDREVKFRRLLRRFLDVCNAVEYAHHRGILHRDLKPANILLGEFGATFVVDWGLAKPWSSQARAGADDSPMQANAAGDAAEVTRVGSVVGTPAYMSPEQARGDNNLDPTSDVYSLGATLYFLLTGTAAFTGHGALETKRRVEAGDFPAPRARRPQVPRPLESICLKAMARERGDRYLSARALADDLERWLADERVAAHVERPADRVQRWSRKYRALSNALLVALGIVAVGASVAAGLIYRAQIRTDEQRVLAVNLGDANRRLADEERVLRTASQRQAVSLQLDKALETVQSDVIRGALELAHCAVAANAAELSDLEGVVRLHLGSVLLDVRPLRHVVPIGSLQKCLFASGRPQLTMVEPGTGITIFDSSEDRPDPTIRRYPAGANIAVLGLTPDGRRLFYRDGERGVFCRDLDAAAANDEPAVVSGVGDSVSELTFSKSGEHALAAEAQLSDDGRRRTDARLLRLNASGESALTAHSLLELKSSVTQSNVPANAFFSRDGRRLFHADRDLGLVAYSTGDGVRSTRPIPIEAGERFIEPEVNGRYLLGFAEGRLRRYDLNAGMVSSIGDWSDLGVEFAQNLGSNGIWFRSRDALSVLRDGAADPDRIAHLAGPGLRLHLSDDGSRVVTWSRREIESFHTSDGVRDGGPLRTADDIREVSSDRLDRIVARSNEDVRIWEPAVGRKLRPISLPREAYDLAAFEHGKCVAVSWREIGNSPAEWTWVDPQSGLLEESPRPLAAGQFMIRLNHDGSRLLSFGPRAGAQLWDAESGTTLSPTIAADILPRLPFQLSPFGELFATGVVMQGQTWLHRVAAGEFAPRTIDASGEVSLSPQHPIGAIVVRQVGALAVFDLLDGAISPLREVPIGVVAPWFSRFSPDGRFLAVVGDAGDVELLEYPSWRSVAMLRYAGLPASLAFSPDSRRILIGGPDGGLSVWDLVKLQAAYAPLVSTGRAWPAEFSPNGRLIVAVVGDQVRLWDAVGGRPIGKVMPGEKFAFLDGGRQLATLVDKEVVFWRLPQPSAEAAERLLADVERRTGLVRDAFGGVRALTQVEWQARSGDASFDPAPAKPTGDAPAR